MMIGAPWYLLAVGIGLLLLGYLIEGLSGPSKSAPPAIHHKMRDKDIINSLNKRESLSKGAVIALLGYVCIGISVLWRLARYFV